MISSGIVHHWEAKKTKKGGFIPVRFQFVKPFITFSLRISLYFYKDKNLVKEVKLYTIPLIYQQELRDHLNSSFPWSPFDHVTQAVTSPRMEALVKWARLGVRSAASGVHSKDGFWDGFVKTQPKKVRLGEFLNQVKFTFGVFPTVVLF